MYMMFQLEFKTSFILFIYKINYLDNAFDFDPHDIRYIISLKLMREILHKRRTLLERIMLCILDVKIYLRGVGIEVFERGNNG